MNAHVYYSFCLFVFYIDFLSLYSPGYPGNPSFNHAGFELRDPLSSASEVLGVKT